MNDLDNYSFDAIFNELLLRIEKDRDSYIKILQSYNKEQLKRIKKLLQIDTKSEDFTILPNDYKNLAIDRSLLDNTDKCVSCSRLIYGNSIDIPTSLIKIGIKNMSIFKAKRLLEKIELSRCSIMVQEPSIQPYLSLSHKDIIKVKNAINFYEQQVIRQFNEPCGFNDNLFTLNEKEKSSIVEEEYEQIIEYLINNSISCIYGNMTSSKKMSLICSIDGKGEVNYYIKNRMIRLIADYTTLGELRQGLVKTKVLDRFISKKIN